MDALQTRNGSYDSRPLFFVAANMPGPLVFGRPDAGASLSTLLVGYTSVCVRPPVHSLGQESPHFNRFARGLHSWWAWYAAEHIRPIELSCAISCQL